MAGSVPINAMRPAGRQAPAADTSFPAIARGHLHEIHCTVPDRAAALAFALSQSVAQGTGAVAGAIFALRAARRQRLPTLFCGDGLALLGIDPNRLILIEAGSEVEMLRAGLEAARCPGISMVLMESEGRFADYDLTASRRLVLAAEASGATILLLRGDAEQRSSGAQTRWSIRSAPSVPLEADAPGLPTIEAELLRCRSGPAGGRWLLSWDAEHGCFRDRDAGKQDERSPVPGAVVSFSRLPTDAGGDGQRQVA
ncbi:hypothetical protein ASE85_08980 [Sphingobium sp. Leaf26]|uniref:ImuA family protein n=1 Tax=Sphingobium sp. Leaf26 TaxID=1735693 RepID=UPI0006FB8AEA|nr:hypothetical protein [Sphingobium sp. Leaf26]KQN00760.1 hypothetical protein ASE85_08980 [Sphingobium sp. Leaf26]